MKTKTKAFIFDLDGVIVDTAKFHFQAWKRIANGLGIDFDHEQNEQLRHSHRILGRSHSNDHGSSHSIDRNSPALGSYGSAQTMRSFASVPCLSQMCCFKSEATNQNSNGKLHYSFVIG